MKQLLQAIDWLLALLPLNGNKLKLGAIIEMAVHIHQMFPWFDVLQWLDSQMGRLGLPLMIIGLVHKAVKKYLDTHAPELLSNSSAKAVTVIDPTSKIPVRPEDISTLRKV